MTDREQIIATTKEAFTVIGEIHESMVLNDPLYQRGFTAGAASRDHEVEALVDVFNKARKFVFEWDNCGSSGEWPVIELANLRESIAKVRKP